MNLTHTHEFLITHITDSGTGFAVRTDNGGAIAASAPAGARKPRRHLRRHHRAERRGRAARAHAVGPHMCRSDALRVTCWAWRLRSTEEPKPVDWADVQREIIAFLRSDEATYCETADIADVVGVETRKLSQHLENMHARGEICKAHVNQRAGQQRASLVLWSIDADVYK